MTTLSHLIDAIAPGSSRLVRACALLTFSAFGLCACTIPAENNLVPPDEMAQGSDMAPDSEDSPPSTCQQDADCPALPNTTATCDASACTYACDEGFAPSPQGGAVAVDGCTCTIEEEVCDGVDNDCDGTIDEDIAPVACALQDGVCAGAQNVCMGDATAFNAGCGEAAYAAYTAASDAYSARDDEGWRCDERDNDCDGDTDEVCCSDDATATALIENGVRFNTSSSLIIPAQDGWAAIWVTDALKGGLGGKQVKLVVANLDAYGRPTGQRWEQPIPTRLEDVANLNDQYQIRHYRREETGARSIDAFRRDDGSLTVFFQIQTSIFSAQATVPFCQPGECVDLVAVEVPDAVGRDAEQEAQVRFLSGLQGTGEILESFGFWAMLLDGRFTLMTRELYSINGLMWCVTADIAVACSPQTPKGGPLDGTFESTAALQLIERPGTPGGFTILWLPFGAGDTQQPDKNGLRYAHSNETGAIVETGTFDAPFFSADESVTLEAFRAHRVSDTEALLLYFYSLNDSGIHRLEAVRRDFTSDSESARAMLEFRDSPSLDEVRLLNSLTRDTDDDGVADRIDAPVLLSDDGLSSIVMTRVTLEPSEFSISILPPGRASRLAIADIALGPLGWMLHGYRVENAAPTLGKLVAQPISDEGALICP